MNNSEHKPKEHYWRLTIIDRKNRFVDNEIDYILHKMPKPNEYRFETEEEADEFGEVLKAKKIMFYINQVYSY